MTFALTRMLFLTGMEVYLKRKYFTDYNGIKEQYVQGFRELKNQGIFVELWNQPKDKRKREACREAYNEVYHLEK